MDVKLVFAGAGGQGIVLLTRLLGTVLTEKGFNVISTETHGMATRGGSVVSFMKVGNYHCPLILPKTADIGVLLHPDESDKIEAYCREDALVVGYNLPVEGIDVKGLMEKEGLFPRVANMVVAGLLLRLLGAELEDGLKFLKSLGKDKDYNVKALTIGYQEAKDGYVSAAS